jgi:AcrR family transcriptional regulator
MSVSSAWGPAEFDAASLRARVARERFAGAIADALTDKPYDELTVADVCAQVGASRRTFYQHFDDKLDCLLGAYDAAVAEAMGQARAACDAAGDWAAGIRAGLQALLDAMAAHPGQARLCVMEILAAGHPGRARHSATMDALAAVIDAGAAEAPDDLDLPPLLGRAAAGACFSLIYEWVGNDRTAELPELAPQLVSIVLVPYVGRTEAARHAGAARPLRLAG